jgi:hypothetical protein
MSCQWKWSNGEEYCKSSRNSNDKNLNNETLDFDTRTDAITQSLEPNSFFNQDTDMINITNTVFSRNQSLSSSKRETLDDKISDRQMIAQRGVNPFMQNNYVNDVVARDIFLKPKNTNFSKE